MFYCPKGPALAAGKKQSCVVAAAAPGRGGAGEGLCDFLGSFLGRWVWISLWPYFPPLCYMGSSKLRGSQIIIIFFSQLFLAFPLPSVLMKKPYFPLRSPHLVHTTEEGEEKGRTWSWLLLLWAVWDEEVKRQLLSRTMTAMGNMGISSCWWPGMEEVVVLMWSHQSCEQLCLSLAPSVPGLPCVSQALLSILQRGQGNTCLAACIYIHKGKLCFNYPFFLLLPYPIVKGVTLQS